MERAESFADLVAIMDRLRDPGGCPWDREQTFESLRAYVLEEGYEVAEAIDLGDLDGLREELGDLLLQVVFLSRLAKEEGRFTIDDVVRGIAQKMVRRHPHVFGDAEAGSSEEVLVHWERIKRDEKKEGEADDSVLAGVPKALPAMMKAALLGTRAARVGFDWKRASDVVDKVEEELRELREAVAADDREAARGEMGDLFFSLVNLARKLDLDPEESLERTNHKFRTRFRAVESEIGRRGLTLEQAEPALMERLWEEAKKAES
ncbi:MAG: nucleoside triphosphate pyrophosphohydrolase [Acidobacteriota bacterium]|nr:nucleoside triphosphate pyrophosphohydrolase [Acidobacteriota bacterium]